MTAYVENIAYIGEKPWHGIGFELPKDATPDLIMKAAELDWTVSKKELVLKDNPKTELKRHFAIVRDSDKSVLSVVGPRYVPVQNKEVFEFFKRFCDAGKMSMETAGSLKSGRYVWALAKLNDTFRVNGSKDQVSSYLLLSSPYEPNISLVAQFTPIRVVCWNTLNFALGSNLKGKGEHVIRLPHVREFDANIQIVAQETLEAAHQQMVEFKKAADFLATVPAAEENVHQYFVDVFKLEDAVEKAKEKGKEPRLLTFLKAANDHGPGANMKTAKGTWWGALNAATYIVDHNRGHSADGFLYNAWYGSGAIAKRQAVRKALEWAKAA